MQKPRGIRRVLGYTIVPTTILATGLFVSASSYSVFNAKSVAPNNSWTAGTVALESDGSNGGATGTAIFSADVSPGVSGTKCITVTSNGTVPSAVRLYGANYGDTNSLGSYLTLQVRAGTATSTTNGACTGFASSGTVFSSGHLSTFPTGGWTNGLATGWSPTGSAPESRVFEFSYTMDSNAPSSTQNGTAHIDFVWEAQGA
jgi:hypothetical protein